MKRRDFLIGAGGAAAIGASVPLPALAGGQPRIVIYDPRYASARSFAVALRRPGAVMVETTRDVVRVWYGGLGRVVKNSPGLRIAGLTTYADFQVMQACGREAGLKLMHHAVHDGREGKITHTVVTGRDLTLTGADWPVVVAKRLSPAAKSSGKLLSPHRGTLVSWLLA